MDIEKVSEAIGKAVRELNLAYNGNVVYKTDSITLELSTKLIEKVEKEAVKRGMKVVVAVVNAGGNPVAVHCMDDSFMASYEIALNKAYTAVALKMPTKELAKLANPNGGSLYGIQNANPRVVIFGGGEPLEYNGKIIGGVAVSGGTAVEDTSLGEFAKNTFKEMISWQLTKK